MKYRFYQTDCDYLCNTCVVDINVQVKKWYGWVTFCVISDQFEHAYDRLDQLKKDLRGQWL